MQVVIRVQHVKHIVFVVGDVQVAQFVKDHALGLCDPELFSQKLRYGAVSGNSKNLVLLAVADQQRSVRSQRDAFSRNQSFVFAGH